MNRQEIAQKVAELAAEQAGVTVKEILPATHFVNDLNFDSLDVVEFAMSVEDEFEVSMPDEDVESIHTVGEVTEYLAERIGEAAAK